HLRPETNHPDLTTEEVVASYRQLMQVEHAFRILKSLVKLRPIYHYRDRRVETHVFICFLAYLMAKLIEQRLRRAGASPPACPRPGDAWSDEGGRAHLGERGDRNQGHRA